LAPLSGKVGEPVVVATEETQEQRLQAIAFYASQVPVIFHFREDLRGAVVNFAREWLVGSLGPPSASNHSVCELLIGPVACQ
jgi:LmbE family N-acetylglucosaminyl deacetylase